MAQNIKDQKRLVQNLQQIHKDGGNLTQLTRLYTDAAEDSAEFSDMKMKISQILTGLRKDMKKMCEQKGIPVARVEVLLPTFRENRDTGAKKARAELFNFLMEEADETDAEDGE